MNNDKVYIKNLAIETIKQNLAKGNYDELSNLALTALEKGVTKRLAFEVNIACGMYFSHSREYISSVRHLNKARTIYPARKQAFDALIKCFEDIYSTFKEQMSAQDYQNLIEALDPIVNFHQVYFPQHKIVVARAKKLIGSFEYNKSFVAGSKVESAVSFRLLEIKNIIYEDMTLEEMYNAAAKILAPTLREIIKEKSEKKETPSKKKKKDKKKE